MRAAPLLLVLAVAGCSDDVGGPDVSPAGKWTVVVEAERLSECRDNYRNIALPFDVIEAGEGEYLAQTRPNTVADPALQPEPALEVSVDGDHTLVVFEVDMYRWEITLWPETIEAEVTWSDLTIPCTVEAVEARLNVVE
jgi:hypothetical protein